MSKKNPISAHGPARDLVALVDGLRAPLSSWTAWRVSIEMMFYALTMNEEKWQAAFAEVKDHDPTYDKKLGTVMGACMAEMHDDPQDILGEAYMAIGPSDKQRFAQFFTPDTVAESMAKMLFSDVKEEDWTKPGGLRVLEPSAGAGVMLIHSLNEILVKGGPTALARTYVQAVDLDAMCCMMTAIQLYWWSLMHAPIGVVNVTHGDFLLAEDWESVAVFGVTPRLLDESDESPAEFSLSP